MKAESSDEGGDLTGVIKSQFHVTAANPPLADLILNYLKEVGSEKNICITRSSTDGTELCGRSVCNPR